jgi:hypothetical protein
MTYDGVRIDTLYTPLGTTGNYSAIADFRTLQFTVTSYSVLSLLQSPLADSRQRILTQELSQPHRITYSEYHCTTAHIQSSFRSRTFNSPLN